MKLIPSTPFGTDSRAERTVFDKLKEAFPNGGEQAPRAFHSLRLSQHRSKRFCEMDFLICGPQGIFALEVKGGGISCTDGRWSSKDRSGSVHDLRESPFRQAEGALHALKDRIHQELPGLEKRFTLGYGVIFPDCQFEVRSAEWERPMLADMRDVRDLEGWLNRLFRHWRQRDVKAPTPSSDDLKRLFGFLRPEFDVAESLFSAIANVEARVASLTEDQMGVLDTIDANPRVLCAGGAGTGKTFLAVELAKRWLSDGRRVAVVCRSPWLRRYLEQLFSGPDLVVATVDGLELARRRSGGSVFDALIVDEGQDLFDMNSLDRLDASIANGLGEGRWCIFHDSNNQSGLFGEPDPEAFKLLSGFHAAKVVLRTNCRNTRVILDKIKRDLGADMGVRGAGEGPPVRENVATSEEDAAKILSIEIHALTEVGGIDDGSITILSPRRFNESCVRLLPSRTLKRVVVLDEFSMRSFPPTKISFSEIAAFKGLENEAVIVVDLCKPAQSPRSSNIHYIAMTRGRAVLSAIYCACT